MSARVERLDEARHALGQREHLGIRAIRRAGGGRYDRRAHREAPHQDGEVQGVFHVANIDTPFAPEPAVTGVVDALKSKARVLKRHALTVYFAARDPRTPLPVRLLALCIAAYAFSPIDLIPDFIPVLGYLDDLVLIPLGVALVVKLVPLEVMQSAQARAEQAVERPTSRMAAAFVIAVWIAVSIAFVRWAMHARG